MQCAYTVYSSYSRSYRDQTRPTKYLRKVSNCTLPCAVPRILAVEDFGSHLYNITWGRSQAPLWAQHIVRKLPAAGHGVGSWISIRVLLLLPWLPWDLWAEEPSAGLPVVKRQLFVLFMVKCCCIFCVRRGLQWLSDVLQYIITIIEKVANTCTSEATSLKNWRVFPLQT